MTPAAFYADLSARGVEFQVLGNKLRFCPVDRLNTVDLENLRLHKVAILRLLRSERIDHGNSVANPKSTTACDRCGSPDYVDVPIHSGESTRRDCSRCHRFMGWPCWYGQRLDQQS
jgi:hypothetical protein